jgi:cyclase
MVKKRLIPVLYIMNGLIVRSEGFSYHQMLGNVVNEASRFNEWDVDELLYIDITREGDYDLRRDDHGVKAYSNMSQIMENISKVCFMPLAFGGGIRTIEQVDFLIRNGADKVVLNTGAYENPILIEEVAKNYGGQCAVVSIDYKSIDGEPVVHTNFGQTNTGKTIYSWLKECEDHGAGEIFLNNVDRDGFGNGYDIEVIKKAVETTSLPVIACGGAGDFYDFLDLAELTDVSGIAAGNIFHFTERAYPRAKQLLKKNNINVR